MEFSRTDGERGEGAWGARNLAILHRRESEEALGLCDIVPKSIVF
jgi:hypothetical protein